MNPPANPYEAGTRKVIPAVLVYVRKADRVLMLHRSTRAGDYHSGKWNGLGGKLEADESPRQAALREVQEEAGLVLEPQRTQALGVLHFPNFQAAKHEDWTVFVFVAHLPPEHPWEPRKPAQAAPAAGGGAEQPPEGELFWVREEELLGLNLWAGDREFLPWVMQERPFMGTLWYQGEALQRSEILPLVEEEGPV